MLVFLDTSPHWIWLALVFILLAVEALVVPSGLLLSLATAACVVAGVTFFFPALSWLWSLTLFALLSVVAAFCWWKFFWKNRGPQQGNDPNEIGQHLVGRMAVLERAVEQGVGRVRLGDTTWTARADEDMPAGTKVVVTAASGATLTVRAASS